MVEILALIELQMEKIIVAEDELMEGCQKLRWKTLRR